MKNYVIATTDPKLDISIKFVKNSSLVNAYLTEYNNYFGYGLEIPSEVEEDDDIIDLVMTKLIIGCRLGILIEEIPSDYC